MKEDTHTKDRILALASERFFREGFSRVSVDELASGLAVSKKTIYKYFDSKDDLVGQVMHRQMSSVRNKVVTIIESDRNFIDKLDALMTTIGVEISKFSTPFQRDLQRQTPELWQRVSEFRRKAIFENLSRLLIQGVQEGYVRSSVNTRVCLLAYLGVIDQIVRPDTLAQEPFSSAEALRSILSIFFHGILTQDAGKELEQRLNTQQSHQV